MSERMFSSVCIKALFGASLMDAADRVCLCVLTAVALWSTALIWRYFRESQFSICGKHAAVSNAL